MNASLWQLAGWTMIHSLWLGAAVALAGGFLRLACRRAAPNTRYAISLATLAALAITPIAAASWLGVNGVPTIETALLPLPPGEGWGEGQPGYTASHPSLTLPSRGRSPQEQQGSPAGQVIDLAHATPAELDALAAQAQPAPPLPTNSQPTFPTPPSAFLLPPSAFAPLIPHLPTLWLIGAPLTFTLLATGLLGSARLRRRATPITAGSAYDACERLRQTLNITRRVALAACDSVAQPILVGILRPLILLPTAALAGWTPDELDMVLLHELAHVRRWDNLVNLLQRIVESLLFFHPAVWLLSRQVRRDREECCDAAVIRHTDRPHQYAELLVSIASALRGGPAPSLAVASAMASHPLAGRIRLILNLEEEPMRITRRTLVATLLLPLLLAGAIFYSGANAEDPPHGKEQSSEVAAGDEDESTSLNNSEKPAEASARAKLIDGKLEEGATPIRKIYPIPPGTLVDPIELAKALQSRHLVDIDWGEHQQGIILSAPKEVHERVAALIEASAPKATKPATESASKNPPISGEASAQFKYLRELFSATDGYPPVTQEYHVPAGVRKLLEAMLEGLEKDPYGPQISFRRVWSDDERTVEVTAPLDAHSQYLQVIFSALSLESLARQDESDDGSESTATPPAADAQDEALALQNEIRNLEDLTVKAGGPGSPNQGGKATGSNANNAQPSTTASPNSTAPVPLPSPAADSGGNAPQADLRSVLAETKNRLERQIAELKNRAGAADGTEEESAAAGALEQKILEWEVMNKARRASESLLPDGPDSPNQGNAATGSNADKAETTVQAGSPGSPNQGGEVTGSNANDAQPTAKASPGSAAPVQELKPPANQSWIDEATVQKLFEINDSNPTVQLHYSVPENSQKELEASIKYFEQSPTGCPIERRWSLDGTSIRITAPRLAHDGFFKVIFASFALSPFDYPPDTEDPRYQEAMAEYRAALAVADKAIEQATSGKSPEQPPFPTLENQKIADRAYKLLGLELEPLSAEDLERVKKLGYAGGLRVTGSNMTGALQKDDLLVGLHVWPVTDLPSLDEILRRPDLGELAPLKYYALQRRTIADELVTGRLSIPEAALLSRDLANTNRMHAEMAAIQVPSDSVTVMQPPTTQKTSIFGGTVTTAYLKVKFTRPTDAIDDSTLRVTPQEIERSVMNRLALIKSPNVLKAALDVITPREAADMKPEEALVWLTNRLSATFPGDGEILELKLEGGDAKEDNALLQAVIDAFIAAMKVDIASTDVAPDQGQLPPAPADSFLPFAHAEGVQLTKEFPAETDRNEIEAFAKPYREEGYEVLIHRYPDSGNFTVLVAKKIRTQLAGGPGSPNQGGAVTGSNANDAQPTSNASPGSAAPVQEPEPPASSPAEVDGPPTATFLYDGKTFERWRDLWKLELNPERRTEAINAMAAFGRAGYGKEAANEILDVAAQYRDDGTANDLLSAINLALGRMPADHWMPQVLERINSSEGPQQEVWRQHARNYLRSTTDTSMEGRRLAAQFADDPEDGLLDEVAMYLLRSDQTLNDPITVRLIRAAMQQEPPTTDLLFTLGFQNLHQVPEQLTVLFHPGVQWEARRRLKELTQNGPHRPGVAIELTEPLLKVLDDPDRKDDYVAALRALKAMSGAFRSSKMKAHKEQVAARLEAFLRDGDDKQMLAACAALAHFSDASLGDIQAKLLREGNISPERAKMLSNIDTETLNEELGKD